MRVELNNISFGYDRNHAVLNNVSMVLDEPGLVCIVGPNGVGKSTLIKCINKLVTPTSGDVLLDGMNVKNMTLKEISKHVGYVPVVSNDCFSMSVVDTILVGRHNHQKWKTTDRDLELVHKVMKMMGIEDLAMRGFNELSAGQHQKVAISRGLVQEPRLLILDEPTSNLDVRHQIYVTELLRAIAIKMGITVLMISHDLNISAKYAHKVIVMSNPGAIYKVGTPEEVITEEVIKHVYGVNCKVVMDESRPHVMLRSGLA